MFRARTVRDSLNMLIYQRRRRAAGARWRKDVESAQYDIYRRLLSW